VVFTLDLFGDVDKKYQDIRVCGEVYVRVSHYLLGFSVDSTPTTGPAPGSRDEGKNEDGDATSKPNLSHITKLYSHPQAWGQCKTFLDTHLKGVERHDVSSTSRAAEIVAQSADTGAAAISSKVAAEVFGLAVLQEGIEDRADNVTRFFVLEKGGKDEEIRYSKEEGVQESGKGVKSEKVDEGVEGKEEDWKTLISLTISHSNPGALAHSLSVFEKYGLNLTSINTRPSGVENWNYIFFVEIKGRRDGGGVEEGAVNKALRDLSRVCRGWRWLGSWENGLKR
jgi:prephenate dehydratase